MSKKKEPRQPFKVIPITMLEWYAGMAMQSLLIGPDLAFNASLISRQAFEVAEEMLARRQERIVSEKQEKP